MFYVWTDGVCIVNELVGKMPAPDAIQHLSFRRIVETNFIRAFTRKRDRTYSNYMPCDNITQDDRIMLYKIIIILLKIKVSKSIISAV